MCLAPVLRLCALLVAGACAALPEPTARFEGLSYSRLAPVALDVPQAIHVLEIDLARPGIALVVSPADVPAGRDYRAETTSQFVARYRLQAAVNGAFFSPFRPGSIAGEDYYPRSGDPVRAVSAGANPGIVCIRKPAQVTIERAERCPPATDHRLAAGPLLIKDGEPQELAASDREPRTAFGVSADGKTAWMVVVDGRQPMWSEGATLEELREIFARLRAADALNLDGGGSTTMVVHDAAEPRVVNSPIHTGIAGRERPVANHLGVRARRADLSPPSPGNGPAAR